MGRFFSLKFKFSNWIPDNQHRLMCILLRPNPRLNPLLQPSMPTGSWNSPLLLYIFESFLAKSSNEALLLSNVTLIWWEYSLIWFKLAYSLVFCIKLCLPTQTLLIIMDIFGSCALISQFTKKLGRIFKAFEYL